MLMRTVLSTAKKTVQNFAERSRRSELIPDCRLDATSPLAEGSDRIFAHEAVKLGYALLCPMPFPQQEYEKDFVSADSAADSLDEFRALLGRASTTRGLAKFELDGQRGNDAAAYAAAGRIVLNQSDLLIVVWDGHEPQGAGGTVHTLHQALAFNVPVLWIDAHAPHTWQIVRSASEVPCLNNSARCTPRASGSTAAELESTMAQLVEELLSPPIPEGSGQLSEGLELFLDRVPPVHLAFLWSPFRRIFGGRSATSRSKPDLQTAYSSPRSGIEMLQRQYRWADELANYFGQCYRSGFIAAYLLSALAVASALTPWTLEHAHYKYLAEQLEPGLVVFESVVILAIVGIVGGGRYRRWHEKWMNYRLMAELIRHVEILAPLGGGRPFPRVLPHLAQYRGAENSEVYWHVRRIERAAALPDTRLDVPYLRAYLTELKQALQGQVHFHRRTQRVSKRIEHRLHRLGLILFGLTLISSLVHLQFVSSGSHTQPLGALLTAICCLCPVLGATFAAINNQGEFARVAKRSHGMAARLTHLVRELDKVEASNTINSGTLIDISLRATQLMVDEVSDWHVIFQDRPAVLPA
jgi:hypothetical protein